ncbi:MAG: OmpH family outer membrane protein [Prevotella sp.]|nr:OmpH family outer membrane protein [Prevotella sp.]
MIKRILFLLLSVVALTASAQEGPQQATALKFACLSYDSVMQAMPAYAEMLTSMAQLRQQYGAEQKRVEDDFNKKYEEFLDGQASFPKTILQKRQSELQELLDKNIAFKKESQKLLDNAQAEQVSAMTATIQAAVNAIAKERGYAFVLNSDKQAVTFVNPSMGEDITEAVKAAVNQPQQ